MAEPRTVRSTGPGALVAAAPHIIGYRPGDGGVVVMGFVGSRMTEGVPHVADVAELSSSGRRATLKGMMATIRAHAPNADRFVVSTWGKFADYESVAPLMLEDTQGGTVHHVHVTDDVFTPIYPRFGFPTPIPPAPQEFVLATPTPAPSRAAHIAQWARSPVDVSPAQVRNVVAAAEKLSNTTPLRTIIAACRLHLERVADPATDPAVRTASIVQVAAVLDVNPDAHIHILATANQDSLVREAVKQTALAAPTPIAGSVMVIAAATAYANGDASSSQVIHALSSVPETFLNDTITQAAQERTPASAVHDATTRYFNGKQSPTQDVASPGTEGPAR